MTYRFGKTSKERMIGVRPELVAVPERALSYGIIDMTIVPYGGLRTEADQKKLFDEGASKTMNSMHRPQSDGYGHALDVVPYPIDWNDIERFKLMGTLLFRAAMELNYEIEWGGHWNWKDYPHIQTPRGLIK